MWTRFKAEGDNQMDTEYILLPSAHALAFLMCLYVQT